MKKIITVFIFSISFLAGYAQYFEGEIIYQNKLKSKMSGRSDQQLEALFGTKNEYYIKNGYYKSISNGLAISQQIYDNAENKLYNKKTASDTLYWFSASINTDTLLNYEILKDVDTVLGFKCNIIVMNTRSGTTKYYYSNNLPIDIAKYKNHHFNNWDFYVSKTKQLPLRIVMDNNHFHFESTAIEVKHLKLKNEDFKLDGPLKKAS
jgi:hypothetical protein